MPAVKLLLLVLPEWLLLPALPPVAKWCDWPAVLVGWLLWKLEAEIIPTVSMTCVPEAAEIIVEVIIDEELDAFIFAALAKDEAEEVIWDNFSAWGRIGDPMTAVPTEVGGKLLLLLPLAVLV